MAFNPKWRRSDIIIFFESIESYLASGLPLNACLSVLEQSSSKYKKQAYLDMRLGIEAGGLFSDGLIRNTKLGLSSASIIRHGESSGSLPESIKLARSLIEHQDELVKDCLSALTYPVVIGFVAVALTIGLVRGVMPQVIPMLSSLHVQLPLLTRIMISTSGIAATYGLYIVCSVVVAFFAVCVSYKKINRVRRVCHSILMHIPLVGSIVHDYVVSVFLHSFGALLDSGVSVGRSYTSTVETISIIPLRAYLISYSKKIDEGFTLSSVFTGSRFPSYIRALVSAGESSGSLGTSCIRAAYILDRNIKYSLKRLTSLIEPLMMVGMGLVVGAIALSIMMPIYDISRVLQK